MAAKKTTTGLPVNTLGALCYVLGPITGILFLLIEKDAYVRFHAMQSILVFGGLFVLQMVMGVTIVLIPLVPVLSLVGFALWLLLIFKAWQGEKWEVPYVGKFAHKLLK
ncbi:MAG: hypothetical protein UV74_C0002G0078 [Candidatus Woesebacteria bacterium GW2011_GWB1_43_14]|uniref:DUF4870 domain-containing protein n=1 Tax=Candidatus Woesebacteria bacterium GW2011_GWB1_43_14 TaxID=1618578 RepID=A0A0G1DMR3_9BACT|nr:MAG: hypothetical protein UV51_C0004G0027 [Candidatus Woesebacteria bacterium GW2011_GWC1_42_9]KKS98857.1 MAG: hypothetical protein UV74_C0002G0078 [Candidatus Woesebacteria bacterium GW2011_GWB1_43_14]